MLPGGASAFGMAGWRFVFFSVAVFSILTGVLNWLFAKDPHYKTDGKGKLSGQSATNMKELWHEAKLVVCVPTFLIIVLQVSLHHSMAG